MNRKFQVFISSTYLDLKAERQTAVQAVLDAGHIPAGMELFAAGDQEQLQVIKRWIDESDVYMLILGVRYGTIEPKSKKSYTRLEYEYAIEQGKPVFAVYLSDESSSERIKELAETIAKEDRPGYEEFRKSVKSKICSEFTDPRDITIAVLKTLNEFARKGELQNAGWVRARDLPDTSKLTSENSQLNMEVSRLTADVARLSVENQHLRAATPVATAKEEEQFGRITYRQLVATLRATQAKSQKNSQSTLLDEFIQNQEYLVRGLMDPNYSDTDEMERWVFSAIGLRLVPFGLTERGTRFNKPMIQASADGLRFIAIYAVENAQGH